MSTFGDFFKEANLIDGEWPPVSGDKIDVNNPATGEVIGAIPKVGATETRAAIEAAECIFQTFSKTTTNERAAILRRMHDVMLKNQTELTLILTSEQGKPLAEANGEIAIGAAYLLWFAEEAGRIYGDIILSLWGDLQILVTKEPVGVIGAITPWNFPFLMLVCKIGPAIGAGCTSVAKPASQTPFSALAWGVIGEKAELPAGVVNVVTGDASEIGGELTGNLLVKKLTSTGFTAVNKIMIRQSADTVKKVSMELGGNAPFIVFEDADIDRAIEGAMISKYRNSGQTYVCTNRFFVQAAIYDAFLEKLVVRTNGLKVDDGTAEGTEQDPLIDAAAVAKIEELVGDATAHGATIAAGGMRHALGGTFFSPTVVSGVIQSMRIAAKEVFGPMSSVIKLETEQKAVSMANDTQFGLACYFYTCDLGRAFCVKDALKYGLVGFNEGIITTVEAPFGGIKEFGACVEGGAQGIHENLDTKYACMGGLG